MSGAEVRTYSAEAPGARPGVVVLDRRGRLVGPGPRRWRLPGAGAVPRDRPMSPIRVVSAEAHVSFARVGVCGPRSPRQVGLRWQTSMGPKARRSGCRSGSAHPRRHPGDADTTHSPGGRPSRPDPRLELERQPAGARPMYWRVATRAWSRRGGRSIQSGTHGPEMSGAPSLPTSMPGNRDVWVTSVTRNRGHGDAEAPWGDWDAREPILFTGLARPVPQLHRSWR